MSRGDLMIQGEWDASGLRDAWARLPDHSFIMCRMADAPAEAVAAGARGRVLEVAAADAAHACRLRALGLETYVVEPSPVMLAGARRRMAEQGVAVGLIRGIAETLPFSDQTFDRVLCDSALDHLADPEQGIREMARVAAAGGRVVLTFVNYGGLTVRGSRLVYRIGRALRLIPPEATAHQFWDSPVPSEHSFECTMANVHAMCHPYLELDRVHGISLGWRFPGWGGLLARLPWLRGSLPPLLDRVARARPRQADFVVSVWRPRPRSAWPADEYHVRPTNPVYHRLLARERSYWGGARAIEFRGTNHPVVAGIRNRALTGNPDRSWIQDLAARGPFRDVAVLGCDDEDWESPWFAAGGSEGLDVYDVSPDVLANVRSRLGPLAPRARLVERDLNFAELPQDGYDCIWSGGALHCLINLEHVFTQVDRALRPGGVFAFTAFVGDTRLQYTPARLEKVNALLATVPSRFRRVDEIVAPDPTWMLSPFQANRSRDILPLARARFDVLREALGARTFPLFLMLDLAGIVREEPALLARLLEAEDAAARDPDLQPSLAYLVLRKRGRADPVGRVGGSSWQA